ncbi:MAG: hypothetical protein AAFX76_11195 [Planctomycetota bacterium]
MNRIQTACFCLIASALVLSGLLVVELSERVEPNAADASLVIARDNFTLLTADTTSDEESLFILDSVSGTLLVYRLDIPREQLIPGGGIRLSRIFDEADDGGGSRRR